MLDRLIARAIVAVVFVLSLAPSPAASASEFLFVDDFEIGATLTGRVLDTNSFVDQGVELPVEGVVVTLLGVSDSSVTGSDGSFILRNVPPGEQVLDLNTGSAIPAPTGDGYAGFRERIVLQGFENVLRPFYLPRIDASSLTTIDPSQTTVVENPGLEISMTVVAGSARGEDGSLFDGQLSISEVPGGVAPAALPAFLEPGILITVQPVGVTFDPPAPITFPNFDNLPPGSETDLWSLDPELGQFAIVGTGQVSGDGERIETISGGIIAADWHGAPPPPPEDGDGDGDGPPSCKGCCPSCSGSVGSSVDLFNGEFSESVQLPTVLSMNREWAPEFVYTSKRAFPLSVIPINSGIVSRAATPNMISYRGFIEDELAQDEIFIDTSTLAPATDEPFRVAVPFDNTALETGIHDAEVRITSIYDRSRISSSNATPLTVVNEIDSPFGAGWSLNGLDRLVLDEPGTIRERLLLVQGDGGAIQLEEQLTGVNPDGIITILSHNDPTAPVQTLEINAIQGVLGDMGHASQVVFRADFTQEVVDQSKMILFFDASFVIVASNSDIQQVPDLLLEARANGMPLYFLGPEPANFRNFGNTPEGFEFIDKWLQLVHLELASSSNGGQGVVNVLDTNHPIFDGAAGAVTQYEITDDSDVTRGSNTGETVLANTATADIVLVAESEAGGRTAVQNHALFVLIEPEALADVEIVFRNTINWLLESPSINSGFFGEGQFAAVDGDYSGIIRDEVAGTFTRVLRDGTIHLYDDSGLLTSVIDRNGNMTTHGYDGSGRLQTITDPAGRVTTFAYDANGNLDTVTDAAGRITDFTVDASGNLSDMTFPDGSTRGFGYDARHLMTSQTSARGFTTQYEYDDLGFFERSTQADGSVREVSPTQKIGLVDTSGGLGTPSNPAPIVRPASALSGFTDPEGRVLVAGTGPFGEPTEVAGFDGLLTDFDRDENGNPLQFSPPSGAIKTATFDSQGNQVTATEQSLGGSWSFGYEASANRVNLVEDPFGQQFSGSYDGNGNLTGATTPLGRVQTFSRDSTGMLGSWIDRFGVPTTISYDAQQLIDQVTVGTGSEQRNIAFTRTAWGAVASITDPLGQTTSFSHDVMGARTGIQLPDGETIALGRNEAGILISVTPPGRPIHNMSYTSFGLLASYVPPAVSGLVETTWSYNLAQELTRVDRPDGRSIVYSYDGSGRLATRQVDRGTVAMSYDALTGKLTGLTAPGAEALSFTYQGDFLATQTWSGTVNAIVAQTRDAAARHSTESIDGQNSITWTYDDDHLLIGAGDLAINRDNVSGYLAGTVLGLVTDSWAYNAFGEPVGYSVNFDGSEIYAFSMTRDGLGRVDTNSESIFGVTTAFDYSYDGRDRLQRVDRNGVLDVEYSYDANSNILERDNGGNQEFGVYDDQDRLISYNGLTYTYRQSGELHTRGTTGNLTTYDYDEVGNLLSVSRPDGVTISYALDGADRRIGKRIDGTLVKGWVYRDRRSIVAEYDGAGNLISRFVYGTDELAPDYMVRNGTTYRLVRDHAGSLRLVVDVDTGTIAQRIDYDPAGRVIADTNPGFQPFGFAGGHYDPDTGLVRFGARDYDPASVRWTAKDPIGFEGGTPNLYLYADGDPINFVDPSGLNPSESDDTPVLAGKVIDVDGPRLWVVPKRGGTQAKFQLCEGQSVFLGDKLIPDEGTRATVQLYMGGRATIGPGETTIINSMESVANPPRPFFKVDKGAINDFFKPSEREFEIQTAGGTLGGIEG